MKNYALSGYLFGAAWGWIYAIFRWNVPNDLAWWQAVIIGAFMPLVSSGLIGLVAGLIAGVAILQSERAKQKRLAGH